MTDQAKGYAVDKNLMWKYPWEETPPKGIKIAILTGGGIQITGDWKDNVGYLAWQRLFKRDHAKEEEHAKSLQSISK